MRIKAAIVILSALVTVARAEPALKTLDGPHAAAFDSVCARINDGRSKEDGLLPCRRIAAARRVGPFARVEVYNAVFDAYVAVELGTAWYVGFALPINGVSDSSWAEVVTIRRVVIRDLELSGLGTVAVLRFRMQDAEYDFCPLHSDSCRDHRRHLRSARTYDVWQVCAIIDKLPACSEALDARPW